MRSPFGKKLKGFMVKVARDDIGSKIVDEPSEQVPFTVVSEPNAKPTIADTEAVKDVSKTNADQVLTEIMKDLRIGELAVREMESGEVSEFDGQSAKSLEGGTSEESEDDQVARRVDAVVAAAEEIRKKKNAEKSASRSISRKKETETEPPEGRDEEEDVVSDEAEVVHPSTKSVKSKASKRAFKTFDKILDTSDDELELRKEKSASLSTLGTADDTYDEINNGCMSGTNTDTEEDTIDMNVRSTEEETRTVRTNGTRGKKTIMNKDVIIHTPGGPENFVVRKMYYTPIPQDPEEVVIRVEVSVLLLLLCFYSCVTRVFLSHGHLFVHIF